MLTAIMENMIVGRAGSNMSATMDMPKYRVCLLLGGPMEPFSLDFLQSEEGGFRLMPVSP